MPTASSILLVFALASSPLQPEPAVTPEPAETPRIALADLSWLEGCWEGTAFGQAASECWMRTPNGRLTGMFQLLDGDRQRFSEIFVLDFFEDGPALRLKHFNPDLSGWEEKNDFIVFRLRETGTGFARFDGLDYRLDENGELLIALSMKRGEERHIERMRFRRTR